MFARIFRNKNDASLNRPIVSSGKNLVSRAEQIPAAKSPETRRALTVSNGRDLGFISNFKSAEHYSLGKRSPADAAIAAHQYRAQLKMLKSTFESRGQRSTMLCFGANSALAVDENACFRSSICA